MIVPPNLVRVARFRSSFRLESIRRGAPNGA
jgi:hypothetical protein